MQQKFLYIFSSILSVLAYGQVNMSLKSDKSDYNAREIVNLTIKIELNGDHLVQQSPVQLPDLSKFNIIGSGSVTNALVDPETNTSITQLVTRIALEPKQKGKIKVGSVLITVNNKIYKTEPFNIFIRDVEKRAVAENNDSDVFLNLEIEDRNVYQDQPTLAVLRVYSKNMDNLRKVKNVQLPQQENLNVHAVNYKRSAIDPSGIGNMPSQILAVFMVFPTESGYVEVPSFSASVNSYAGKSKVLSNTVKINVKKLPKGAPKYFKNAVGKFALKIENKSTGKIEQKKPLHITVKVAGEGNLADLVLPKIVPSEKYEIFQPNNKITSLPGKNGLKGEVSESYVLIPKDSGNFEVKTEAFAFFDPQKKKYVDVGEKSLKLAAFTHDQVLAQRSTVQKVNEYTNTLLETVNNPVIKTTTFKVVETQKVNWNVLLINALVLGSLGFGYMYYRKKKRKTANLLTVSPQSMRSISETENVLKDKHATQFVDYFAYLEQLQKENQSAKFYAAAEELDDKFRSEFNVMSDREVHQFLEEKWGVQTAEEYRTLKQKLQLEKYSPVSVGLSLHEIYQQTLNLYRKITK